MAWTGSAVGVRLPRSEGAQVPILSDKGRSPHRSGPGRLWRGSRLPSRCELLPQTATKGRRVTLFGSARARRLARSASRRRALAADHLLRPRRFTGSWRRPAVSGRWALPCLVCRVHAEQWRWPPVSRGSISLLSALVKGEGVGGRRRVRGAGTGQHGVTAPTEYNPR